MGQLRVVSGNDAPARAPGDGGSARKCWLLDDRLSWPTRRGSGEGAEPDEPLQALALGRVAGPGGARTATALLLRLGGGLRLRRLRGLVGPGHLPGLRR